VTGNITATFSEQVQGVDGGTFTLTAPGATAPLAATVTPGTGNQWVLNPNDDLTPNTTYTARLTGGTGPTGIRDMANNPLATTTWTFTTAAAAGDATPPTVTAQTPQPNARGVSRSANVTIAFSEPVTNVTTTTFALTETLTGAAVPAAVRFNSTSGRWVLDPTAALLSPTTSYTVTLTPGITDLNGNAFAGTSFNFTTQA
jgi:hypothetical protein